MNGGWLTIGQLAREVRVSTDTIRYYESVGLLPPPTRSDSGYRLYSRAEQRRLLLIARAKLLGLSLQDIKVLVDQTFNRSCEHLQQKLLERIPGQLAELERRMNEMQALKDELHGLHRQLAGLRMVESHAVVADCDYCPVVEGTAGEGHVADVARG